MPDGTKFSRQVHGSAVWCVVGEERLDRPSPAPTGESEGSARPAPPEADAVLGRAPGSSVGIVTADCVPILAAAVDGSAVVAIHAGWRGLAVGVIESGLDALRAAAPGREIAAAIGPSARGCCYEVDDSVRRALGRRYRLDLESGVLRPTRAGHFLLDLPLLAERVLVGWGLDPTRVGTRHRDCTICDPARFDSYRRDGGAAGRMRHFIVRSPGPESRG